MSSLFLQIKHLFVAHGWLLPILIFTLGIFVIFLFLFSPFITLAIFLSAFIFVAALIWPWPTLVAVIFYLPFEQIILQFLPDSIYLVGRFLSEGLIYLLTLRVAGECLIFRRYRRTPFDLPLLALAAAALLSLLVNLVPFEIGFAGLRNIFRFVLILFLVIQLRPSRASLQKIIFAILILAFLQSIIGLSQAALGYRADEFLQPQGVRYWEDIQLTTGVIQTWDPGQRISATFGRYDRFGTWLSFALLLSAGFFYYLRRKKIRWWLTVILPFGLAALALTQSRASWFGFLLGFFTIAVILKRDKRFIAAFIIVAILLTGYFAYSNLTVRYLLDPPGAGLGERFFEAFSATRWQAEYYDLGRLYFIVQTPIKILTQAPLFGVGPGRYGGGVAASFHVTDAYDKLGLPFGIHGEQGFIDNSWLSLFGELGLLGTAAYIWLLITALQIAYKLFKNGKESFDCGYGLGLFGLIIAAGFEAFLATHFEIRTFAGYFWFFVGLATVLYYEQQPKIT